MEKSRQFSKSPVTASAARSKRKECFSHRTFPPYQDPCEGRALTCGSTHLGCAGWHSRCCWLQLGAAAVQAWQELCAGSSCGVSCCACPAGDGHGVSQVPGVQLVRALTFWHLLPLGQCSPRKCPKVQDHLEGMRRGSMTQYCTTGMAVAPRPANSFPTSSDHYKI